MGGIVHEDRGGQRAGAEGVGACCAVASSESTPRARPKSHIFRSQFLLTSRLPGLRSRCSTLALCIALSPRKICRRHPRVVMGSGANQGLVVQRTW